MFLNSDENISVKRKRSSKGTTTNYFDVREEEAVRNYILADTKEEKEVIYNQFLKDPLDKMVFFLFVVFLEPFHITQKLKPDKV